MAKLKWRHSDVLTFWEISLCTIQNMQEKIYIALVDI